MKYLLLHSILVLTLLQVQAQQSISFKGQIKNAKADEPIYLGLEGVLIKIALLENGTFSANANIQEVPSFFYLGNIEKSGKIVKQTPRIWFDKTE